MFRAWVLRGAHQHVRVGRADRARAAGGEEGRALRGHLRYIMGANIATLGDTLLAAFLLGSPEAIRIVLAGIPWVAIVSVAVLAFAYEPPRAMAWRSQHGLARNKTRLACFTAALFGILLAMIGASWLLS